MRISDRYYRLLSLKLRVERALQVASQGRAGQHHWRAWRLLALHHRLRSKINALLTHPILLR